MYRLRVVAHAVEEPCVVGVVYVVVEEVTQWLDELRRDLDVAHAVGGLGWADLAVGVFGEASAPDVQDAVFKVDVTALQCAHLTDAQPVTEDGEVDAHAVFGRHGLVDGVHLLWRRRHGRGFAFGCGHSPRERV